MCGINGFNWKDDELILNMNNALSHRGPDDQYIYTDERVSLGHRRLSIVDLSPAGRQPMANEDGSIWIIFNGEIYNFSEIRPELERRGHKFRSGTDTEVIIHAYEEWSTRCVERFNGMWDFAIYDKGKNLLFLSRDRFGVKPLYYYQDDRGIIFSSEIAGILQHDVPRSPNEKIVYQFLAFGLVDHTTETFFKGILSLGAGENLIYDLSSKSIRFERWYDLESRIEDVGPLSDEDLANRVRNLFQDCVRYRLIADVPVGSCLSGGIDSSSIVCAMRHQSPKKIIKTFSLVFPGLLIDESEFIDEVIKQTKVQSYKETPTLEELLAELEDLVATQGEPFGSLSIYGQYKVMQLAKKNDMKVLLDGQGSDEIFAGYQKYHNYYLFACLKKGRFGEFLRMFRPNFLEFVGTTLMGKTQLSRNFLDRLKSRKSARFVGNFYKGDKSYPLFKSGFDLNLILREDVATISIPHLLRYEDRNSMRWSIESRVPFMDYRLVELALSLGYDMKINNGVTKYIFRKAMDGMVPSKILARRDKIGFATPDSIWLCQPKFIELINGIIDSAQFQKRPYWIASEVKKLFKEHIGGKKDNSGSIWRIINMEIWLRTFIDRPAGS
jgi:asparagine synthase (glutamine-hydrolysing)